MSKNQIKKDLKQLKEKSINFKIQVSSSQNVVQLLDIYDLTPAEFFRPYADFRDETVTFKTLKETQKSIPNFRVEFVDKYAYQNPPKKGYDAYAKMVLDQAQPDIQFSENQPENIDMNQADTTSKWFEKSCEPLYDLCQYNYELNFLDQPVCLIYCLHVKDINPEKLCDQMHRENSQLVSDSFKYSQDDDGKVTIQRANFIFYDNSNSQQALQVQQVVNSFKKNFPLSLNKAIPLFTNIVADRLKFDIFEEYQYKSYRQYYLPQDEALQSTKQNASLIISNSDFQSIRVSVRELLKTYVFQNIEQRMFKLFGAYNETRKQNLFQRMLNANKDQKKGGPYKMSQKEITLRHLGDLNYIIQEYDQSVQFYKLMMDEVQKKSQLHYANAVEGWVNSMIFNGDTDGISKQEQSKILDTLQVACNIYFSNEQLPYMIRTLVLYIKSLYLFNKCDRQRIQFVWDYTYKIKNKTLYPIMHVVLLEQYAKLFVQQGSNRKFSLHTLFAGYKYGQNGFKHHALNCFIQIQDSYEKSEWRQLKDFIYKYMTKYSCETGHYKEAIKHIKASLNNAEINDQEDRHQQIITDTLKVLTTLDQYNLDLEQREILLQDGKDICVPKISDFTVDIKVQDEMINTPQQSVHTTLRSIQDPHFNSYGQLKSNVLSRDENNPWIDYGEILLKTEQKAFLEIQKDKNLLKSMGATCVEQKQGYYSNQQKEMSTKYYRQTFAGEVISVKFEIENILKQPFELKDFNVIFDFYDNDNKLVYSNNYKQSLQKRQNEKKQSNNNNKQSEELDLLDMNSTQDQQQQQDEQSQFWQESPVKMVNQNIIFQVQEKKQLGAKLIPNQSGYIVIQGLQWIFMNIPNQKLFSLSNNYLNKLQVLQDEIQLDIKVQDINESNELDLFYGEIKNVDLILKNLASGEINNIEVSFVEPTIFGIKNQSLQNINIGNHQTYNLNINIRAFQRSNFEAKILIKYKNDNFTRYHRFIIPINVKPSISIKSSIQKYFNSTALHLSLDLASIEKQKQVLHKQQSAKDQEVEDDLLSIGQSQTTQQNQNATELQDLNQIKIENILIMDKNWTLKKVPLNTQLDLKGKCLISLMLDTKSQLNSELNNNQYSEQQGQQQQKAQNLETIDLLDDGHMNSQQISQSNNNTEPNKNNNNNENGQRQEIFERERKTFIPINLEDIEVINLQKVSNEPQIQYPKTNRNSSNIRIQQQQNNNNINEDFNDLLAGDDDDTNNKIQQKNNNNILSKGQNFQIGPLSSETICNFVNLDHQMYFDLDYDIMWYEQKIPFDHPQLCSFLIIYSIQLENSKVYGIYDLVKKKMNAPLFQNLKFNSSPLEYYPLKIKVDFPQKITHDFSADPVMVLNSEIEIINSFSHQDISFKFEAIDSDDAVRDQSDISYPQFQWEGNTKQIIENLKFEQSVKIRLQAQFTSVGIYDLSRFKYTFYKNSTTHQVIVPTPKNLQEYEYDEKSFVLQERDHYLLEIVEQLL